MAKFRKPKHLNNYDGDVTLDLRIALSVCAGKKVTLKADSGETVQMWMCRPPATPDKGRFFNFTIDGKEQNIFQMDLAIRSLKKYAFAEIEYEEVR